VALFWLAAEGLADVGVGAGVNNEITAAVQHVFPAVFAVVPVMMFVAIVRHQLWDIDVIASRALLMALLLTFLAAVYVLSIAVTGWLLRGAGWVVVIPLVVVACVAEPVRERIQRVCNRLVYGQRTSPREAVQALVERFGGAGDADELTALTHAIVDSTRATRAAIWLMRNQELLQLVEAPAADEQAVPRRPLPAPTLEGCRAVLAPADCRPVMYEGALLGILAVTTPRGVGLTPVESRLLDDLSHHGGLLVANAQLTLDLARELEVVAARAEQLSSSRRQVVQAQDVRRSALESDIHDGAQQHLVALLIQLRTVKRAPTRDSAKSQLAPLRSVLSATQETLARLAAGGAPRVLVESGLRAALEEAADGARRIGQQVHLRYDADDLDAAPTAATAIYFCCLEALQNISKHAQAANVSIAVDSDESSAAFSVEDDGVGFAAEELRAGSGMGNLVNRLASLGGSVEVESQPGRGTTIRGRVPVLTRVNAVPRQRVEGDQS
jgi:signal transduction histidine kinase